MGQILTELENGTDQILVRTYDRHADIPQPSGPLELGGPPARPALVEWNDGSAGGLVINQGWAIRYQD